MRRLGVNNTPYLHLFFNVLPMSTYNELLTLSELQRHDAFTKLVKVLRRLKNGPLEKSSFRVAEDALRELQKLKGLVGQSSVDNVDTFGKPPRNVEEWGVSTSNFFFVRDETQDKDDNRQWVHLVCVRADLQHKFGAVGMRRFPVRMQFEHVRQRLLQRSGTLLELNSDPIIFTALAGTLLAHQLPLIKDAPKQDGIYPVFMPQPLGMFLGYAKPCKADDFGYAFGQSIQWKKSEPASTPLIETRPTLPGVLPGLPGKPTLPGLPGANAPRSSNTTPKPQRPFLQMAASETCVVSDITPTIFPRIELEINTYVDMRMMKGAQRSLFNQQLLPLLSDKELAAGTSIMASVYMIGNMPVSKADKAQFDRIAYADKVLRGIILGPQWGGQSRISLRSYFEANGPTNT